METFSEFFKFGEPAVKLPELEVQMPINALALAIAAVRLSPHLKFFIQILFILQVERALMLYRDDHLEYKDDVLYIKKEKVLDKRAAKGNHNSADNSNADNNGPVYKEIRPVKLDFSATNFKAKVTGWWLSIEKKADTLFPAVCDSARSIAGIAAASLATVNSTQSEYQDPQILARANLASEDEEDTAAEHEVDERRNNDRLGDDVDDRDTNEYHDNDLNEDCNNNESDDGHDKGGDNGIGSDGVVDEDDKNGGSVNEIEEADDEDSGRNGSDGDQCDCGEIEDELAAEGSDLTEIGSSSEVSRNVKYVPQAASSSRGRVQRGRR